MFSLKSDMPQPWYVKPDFKKSKLLCINCHKNSAMHVRVLQNRNQTPFQVHVRKVKLRDDLKWLCGHAHDYIQRGQFELSVNMCISCVVFFLFSWSCIRKLFSLLKLKFIIIFFFNSFYKSKWYLHGFKVSRALCQKAYYYLNVPVISLLLQLSPIFL